MAGLEKALEERLELRYDAGNLARCRWDSSSPECWVFPESYVQGKVALHFHFWVRPESFYGDSHELCIATQQAGCQDEVADNPSVFIRGEPNRQLRTWICDSGLESHEGAVLVLVGVAADEAECPPLKLGPVIGLQFLDECPLGVSDASKALSRRASETSRGIGVVDGEASSASVRAMAIQQNQLIDKVIQRRPEVMDQVAKDRAESWGRFVSNIDPEDVLRAFRIEFSEDAIGIGLEKVENLLVEGVQVIGSPV